MGRCYQSGCCSPYGYPYLRRGRGCGPCAAFSKCYKYDDCCCDSCNSCCNKMLFTASTTAPSPDTPFFDETRTVTFNATSNCYCLYSNNTTFTPKKRGTYNFNTTVPVNVAATQNGTTGNVTLTINKNGTSVTSTTQSFSLNNGQSTTLNLSLSQSICLCPCDNVTITLTTVTSTPGNASYQFTGTRTFCGSKC